MNLRDLGYLVAVAEHRHFGKAAAASFVSQPTLSTQLKKLEAELGVELVERNPGHITLTRAGELVAERARSILAEADQIRHIAAQARDPESGSIRLGLFPTLAPYLLPHVVGPLHARFPHLELLLVEEKTEVVVERLRDGQLDAGVLALPIHEPLLHEELLFSEDFVLAVPAEHPLASDTGAIESSVLAGEHVLLLEEGHCLRDQALAVCQLNGASERSGFRATSLETLRQMVAAGVGVTLLPELAVQPPVPASPSVVLRDFSDPPPRRDIAMFWRRTSVYRDLLPAVAEVIRVEAAALVGGRR
ncbi:LysR substrate-binding domain-containing protein [Rhabdothermincola salaria]|uniref:LysR substrate-binding domain-containing protein n=1 Tax=Rhabdothermincola salaria TaxID=2903142 RepID=UPI001E43E786|nr:LysR substrate-binding domain-containing protein [Rhabdothermincola salaria]MCD9622898.1 LysR substrate-binding domain-containing protein [Rhabdothermincola salaria]